MKSRLHYAVLGALSAFVISGSPVHAAVTADEAAKLKTTLTPMGGEKAGNADGSIPAWTGGMTSDPQYKPGGKRDHLFKDDKPLFSITAANMNQYADQLTEGVKAMLIKYPDSYRLDVYKTERTAAGTQWVYDNTYTNALNGKLENGSAGPMPRNVYGGVPFPIPGSGAEIIWNHELAWRGPAWNFNMSGYLITADGKKVLTIACATCVQQMPYYFPGGSAAKFDAGDGVYTTILLVNAGPPIRAGEGIIGMLNVNSDRDKTWVYLTGQRRTRLLPNGCCDTPTPATAGVMSFDELYVFYGRINRFDWTLVGKKEMYIPYNANQAVFGGTDDEVMAAHHLNPDKLRWEKHRVWVVDATVAPGQRHVAPKGRYYFDEDSWNGLLGERWDANGQLWKVLWQTPFAAPDMPAQTSQTFGFYDLISSAWYLNGTMNNQKSQFPLTDILPASFYTPENMAAMGVR